jgi:hypothetical protein
LFIIIIIIIIIIIQLNFVLVYLRDNIPRANYKLKTSEKKEETYAKYITRQFITSE